MGRSTALGQNFLINAGVADRMVAQVPPGNAPVLEIGPGHGVLTERILKRCPRRSLTVVEKDPRLAAELETRWGGRLRVINADILSCRPADLTPGGGAFLVGNLPYLISTPLMEWILFHYPAWTGGVVMTQDEFARRLMEGAGPLATALRTFFTLTPVMRVSPGSFHPAPRVFSRIFVLEPRNPGIQARGFHAFLESCFRYRRRSLRNNLRGLYADERLDATLKQVEIPADARAEALADTALLALFQSIADYHQ